MPEIIKHVAEVLEVKQMKSDSDVRWTFSVGEGPLEDSYRLMKCKRDGWLVELAITLIPPR